MKTHECGVCHMAFDLSQVDVSASTHAEHKKVTGHDLRLKEAIEVTD